MVVQVLDFDVRDVSPIHNGDMEPSLACEGIHWKFISRLCALALILLWLVLPGDRLSTVVHKPR